jgi:hypothetical protein
MAKPIIDIRKENEDLKRLIQTDNHKAEKIHTLLVEGLKPGSDPAITDELFETINKNKVTKNGSVNQEVNKIGKALQNDLKEWRNRYELDKNQDMSLSWHYNPDSDNVKGIIARVKHNFEEIVKLSEPVITLRSGSSTAIVQMKEIIKVLESAINAWNKDDERQFEQFESQKNYTHYYACSMITSMNNKILDWMEK